MTCWHWQWWHRLQRSAPGCRPAEESHHQQPGLSQAGLAWGQPHSTGVPRAAASSSWVLSASSEPHVAGHLGHNGHRSESQSCDSARDKTAATQGRGTSPEVPWGRATSHSMLDSGALSHSSPSSLISTVSSKQKGKNSQGARHCVGEWGWEFRLETPTFLFPAPASTPPPEGYQGLGSSLGHTHEDLGWHCSERAQAKWPPEDLMPPLRCPREQGTWAMHAPWKGPSRSPHSKP